MDIPVEKLGDVAVAVIDVEEIDAGNSGELKRDITPILQANRKIVIDLERVRFVDSSGLGVILSCLRYQEAQGGHLKLCSMSKPVRTAFELVRMHRVFDIFGSRDEAINAFR